MKVEVTQAGSPGATGNFDINGNSPSNDMVGAWFLNAASTTDDVNGGFMRFGFGATDMNNNWCIAMGAQDATVGATIESVLSTSKCVATGSQGGLLDPQGSCVGTSTTGKGVKLNLTSDGTAGRKITPVLFSGTDTTMKVGTVGVTNGTTSTVVTHNLGGIPDYIIIAGVFGTLTSEDNSGTGISFGFWDRTTTNQSCMAYTAVSGANPTNNAAIASDTAAGQVLTSSTVKCGVTLTAIGATTFTITFSGTAGVNTLWGWIAHKGASQQLFTKNILAQNPTATGPSALIAGMSGRPQVHIALPTRMTAKDAIQTNDTAGSFGFSISCTNDYASTTQGANATTFKNNVATSVARTTISNTQGMLALDNTGAADVQAIVQSWDPAGVTMNYTNAGGSLFYVPVLAVGATIPQVTYIPRRAKRITYPIYYSR